MDKRALTFLLAALMLMAGGRSFAQETHPVGLVFGYPGSLGVIWHVSDSVALRPVVSATRNSSSATTSSPGVTSDSHSNWTLATDLSALFYVMPKGSLRAYLSPKLSYGYAKSSDSPYVRNAKSTAYSAAGSFGVQYAISSRFAVFGEVGIVYTHQKNSSDSISSFPASSSFHSESTARRWGTQTGIGAAFYF